MTIILIVGLMLHSVALSETVFLVPINYSDDSNENNVAGDAIQIDCPENISVFTDENTCSAQIESGLNISFV